METMMSRLKDNFKNFESRYSHILSNKFEKTKSQNVENDFIRVYDLNTGGNIAFAFNNIDKPLEQGLITVSCYGPKNLKYSATYSFENFKNIFKAFMKAKIILNAENVVTEFQLRTNEREENKKKFRDEFIKENHDYISEYTSLKSQVRKQKEVVNELSTQYRKEMDAFSKQLRERLNLPAQEKTLNNLNNSMIEHKNNIYGKTYQKHDLISSFYNQNTSLQSSLGFNIFKTYLTSEIESL